MLYAPKDAFGYAVAVRVAVTGFGPPMLTMLGFTAHPRLPGLLTKHWKDTVPRKPPIGAMVRVDVLPVVAPGDVTMLPLLDTVTSIAGLTVSEKLVVAVIPKLYLSVAV